jgi:predicted GNAT superfamily acetyltransferase
MQAGIVVRPATRNDYVPGARLLAEALGFSAHEAIPAWQMLTSARHGGIALAALRDDELIGWSYAFPAVRDARPYLFSCGLAVRADMRSRGVGRALKLAQRSLALECGYDLIAWTAEPLASPALYLYLTTLGAQVTGYASCLYEGVRDGHGLPQDDVEVEWWLHAQPQHPTARAHELTRTLALDGDMRRLVEVAAVPAGQPALVELPWNLQSLLRRHPDEALRWRTGVREVLTRLLECGYRGDEVVVDPIAHRSFLRLSPPRAHSPAGA